MKFISYCFKTFSPAVSKFLVIIGLGFSMAACQWGDEVVSLVQPDPDEFFASFSDTTTVKLSTVATDSFMTGSQTRLFVGKFTDPYLGIMQARSFIQPVLGSSLTLGTEVIYDSLILNVQYDGYYYGDTTKAVNLSVHALQEDMLLKNAYYSDDFTPYDATPIGKTRFFPNPRPRTGSVKKNIKIRLSETLGKRIFDAAKANLLTTNEQWINILKGVTLMNDAADNSSALGFLPDSTNIQLHYHTTQLEGITKDSTVFRVLGKYNQLLADRSKTVLSKLLTRRASLPSSATNELSFVQAGSGIMTRIDLPSIRELNATKYIFANRAYIIIEPLNLSVTDAYRAPSSLYVYLCDKNNEFLQGSNGFPVALTDLDGQVVTANLINDLVNNKQYYKIDVSQYVSTILRSQYDESAGLLLRTAPFTASNYTYPDLDSEFTKRFDRLVIGSQKNAYKGVKLQMYYTTIKVAE